MSDSGNGQRPSRRNPAGRSCSAVVLAFAVMAAVAGTMAAAGPAAVKSNPAPCGTFDESHAVLADPPYAQADLESNPCNLQIRAHLKYEIHGLVFDAFSGWVETLELNTKATGVSNSIGTFVEYQQENDGGGSRMCQEFYPVKGAWHPC